MHLRPTQKAVKAIAAWIYSQFTDELNARLYEYLRVVGINAEFEYGCVRAEGLTINLERE